MENERNGQGPVRMLHDSTGGFQRKLRPHKQAQIAPVLRTFRRLLLSQMRGTSRRKRKCGKQAELPRARRSQVRGASWTKMRLLFFETVFSKPEIARPVCVDARVWEELCVCGLIAMKCVWGAHLTLLCSSLRSYGHLEPVRSQPDARAQERDAAAEAARVPAVST